MPIGSLMASPMIAFHYTVLACAVCAAVACGFASRRRARLAGPALGVTALLAFADWTLLLIRDSQADANGVVWIEFIDALIILGIAWIPCYFLLRLPLPKWRVPAHAAGSLLAVAWILQHTPEHALPPSAGPGTEPVTVAFCVISFAFLNWVLVLRPPAVRAIGLRAGEISLLWLVPGTVMAIACASLGWALVWS